MAAEASDKLNLLRRYAFDDSMKQYSTSKNNKCNSEVKKSNGNSHDEDSDCDDMPFSAILLAKKRPSTLVDNGDSLRISVKKPKVICDDEDDDEDDIPISQRIKRLAKEKKLALVENVIEERRRKRQVEEQKRFHSVKDIEECSKELEKQKQVDEVLSKIRRKVEGRDEDLNVKKGRLNLLDDLIGESEKELKTKEKESHLAFNHIGKYLEWKEEEHKDLLKKIAESTKELDSDRNKLLKELESKEKQFEGQMQELEKNEKHLEGRMQELESKEEHFEGRVKEIESKEKHYEGRVKELKSKEEEFEEQMKDWESKVKHCEALIKSYAEEKMFVQVELESRVKELEAREEEFYGQMKELESKAKDLRLKEKQLEEQVKMFELKEKEFQVQVKELNLKEKQFEEDLKGLESKRNQFDEQLKELELKEKQCEPLIKSFEEEKVFDNQLSPTVNGRSLQFLPNEELESLGDDILVNLQASSNPSKLVLDIIQNPIAPQCSEGKNSVTIDGSHIILLEQLMKISPIIKHQVREEAMKLALDLKANMRASSENTLPVLAFLLLLSIYGLVSSFDEDEVLKLFELAAQHKQAVELLRTLGFADKISDFVQNLIKKEKRIEAVRFICAYNLADKYEPVDILRRYVQNAKLISEKIKDKARDQEIASLGTVLQCMEDNHLKYEDLLNEIQDRILELNSQKAYNDCTDIKAILKKFYKHD